MHDGADSSPWEVNVATPLEPLDLTWLLRLPIYSVEI
jgi:hypothetical protein